ncbi:hypothetical protein PTKIN_Ptkin15bG0064800 [Pterospermum kingtungense]
MWSKAKWPKIIEGINELLRNPSMVCVLAKLKSMRDCIKWIPHTIHSMKFNVDGTALRQSGLRGIRGALRDSEGKFKILFSKAVGVVDSNLVELLAIEEAFKLFSSSKWVKSLN